MDIYIGTTEDENSPGSFDSWRTATLTRLRLTQTTHIMVPIKTIVRTDVILPMTVSLVFLPASCLP